MVFEEDEVREMDWEGYTGLAKFVSHQPTFQSSNHCVYQDNILHDDPMGIDEGYCTNTINSIMYDSPNSSGKAWEDTMVQQNLFSAHQDNILHDDPMGIDEGYCTNTINSIMYDSPSLSGKPWKDTMVQKKSFFNNLHFKHQIIVHMKITSYMMIPWTLMMK